MQKISPWLRDECGAYRIIEGGDINNTADRVAVIEKTPRVRIRSAHFRERHGTYEDGGHYVDYQWHEFLDWCEGYKGDGPDDEESRNWCDNMLRALGYQL